LNYPNLYWHDEGAEVIREKSHQRRVLGWPTTGKTKPVLERDLGAAIAAGSLTSWDQAFWDECLSYVNLGNGKTGGQSGTHDDRVLAMGIAWQMRSAMPMTGFLPLNVNARYAS
jgi:hypothetical protein